MAEYIDREEFLKRIKTYNTSDKTDKALYNFALNNMIETPTADVIPIPKGATNGDMIKAIFPNARVSEIYPSFNGDEVYYVPVEKFNGVTNEMRVMKSWWNEPYRR